MKLTSMVYNTWSYNVDYFNNMSCFSVRQLNLSHWFGRTFWSVFYVQFPFLLSGFDSTLASAHSRCFKTSQKTCLHWRKRYDYLKTENRWSSVEIQSNFLSLWGISKANIQSVLNRVESAVKQEVNQNTECAGICWEVLKQVGNKHVQLKYKYLYCRWKYSVKLQKQDKHTSHTQRWGRY